jgi:hypothetical protein
MSPLISIEVVVGVLVAVLILSLVYIFVRRRLLGSGAPLMLCAVQADGRGQFRLGLLRLAGGTLEWFTVTGPSLRPSRSWERARIQLESPARSQHPIAGLPESVEVRCHYGKESFALALAPTAYTAVRSWLESSPPGFNVNVA